MFWRIFIRSLQTTFRQQEEQFTRMWDVVSVIGPGWLAAMVGWIILFLSGHLWARSGWPVRCGMTLALAMWVLLDLQYLRDLSIVWRSGLKPFPLQAALMNEPPPVPLRLFVALWWLGHFALPFWVIVFEARHLPPGVKLPLAFDLFVMALWSVSANGFLMLAVCALTASDPIRRSAWRLRVLTELALAALAFGVHAALRHPA